MLDTVLAHAVTWTIPGMQLECCYSTGVHNYPNYAKDARNYSATLYHFRVTTHFEREESLDYNECYKLRYSPNTFFFHSALVYKFPVSPASPYFVHFRCFTTIRNESLTSLLSDNLCSLSEFPQIFLPFMILKSRLVFPYGLYFGRLSSKFAWPSNLLHTVHTACQPTLQHHNSYNRTDNHSSENAVWPPDDGHKDARNMLRNNW
jgi:hypothetical protein